MKLHDAKWRVRILEQIIHFIDRYLQDDAHKTTSFIEYFPERIKPVPGHEYVNFISFSKVVYNNTKEIDTLFNKIVLQTGIEISVV